jgi:hypothetical protein
MIRTNIGSLPEPESEHVAARWRFFRVARYPLRTPRTWPPAYRLAEWHVSDGRNVHAIPFLRLRWKLDQTPSKLSGPLARTSKVDRAWSEMARLQVHLVPVLLNARGQFDPQQRYWAAA